MYLYKSRLSILTFRSQVVQINTEQIHNTHCTVYTYEHLTIVEGHVTLNVLERAIIKCLDQVTQLSKTFANRPMIKN